MDANRQHWSQQQQLFRQCLFAKDRYEEAIRLFLLQHAMLHSAAMSESGIWSFEDEVLAGLPDDQLRHQPAQGMNSIAWLLWHIARIEDVTMNLLVANRSQVLNEDHWLDRLHITRGDVGTSMSDAEVSSISEKVDIPSLRSYRMAVGRRTREIVRALPVQEWQKRVDPTSIQRLLAQDALPEGAYELAHVWSHWKKSGMLTMPATRHSFTHLNQAREVKRKLGRLSL
jgi:hypothetical protein